jgi:hypothetical protein
LRFEGIHGAAGCHGCTYRLVHLVATLEGTKPPPPVRTAKAEVWRGVGVWVAVWLSALTQTLNDLSRLEV